MIVRMSEAAVKRRRGEWVMLAQVVAAGVNAGFSGDWKGINALARSLGVPTGGASSKASDGDVGDLVTRLYARLGVTHGDHGRRASS